VEMFIQMLIDRSNPASIYFSEIPRPRWGSVPFFPRRGV
jgi:hypothetical protein